MLEWFGIQIVLFILYLPWITVITKQFGVVKKGFWISKPEDWRILETLLHFSVSPTGMILMVILCALSPVIIRRINGAGKSGEKILYQSEIDLQGLNKIIMLLIWFAAPVLIPFGLSYFITPIYFYRYAIACSPAYYLICAKGFDNLKIRYLTAGLVTIMVTLGCFNLMPFYTQRQKPDWKEASKYLYANAKENDLMVFSMGLGKNYIFDYYCPDTKLKTDSLPSGSYNFLNIEKYYLSIEDAIELKKKIRGFDRVWIVLYLNTNPNMIIERTMSYLSYKLIEIKDFSSSRPRELTDTLRIYQFEKKH